MDKINAFLLALHPRLGSGSPAGILGEWLMREVAKECTRATPCLLTFSMSPSNEPVILEYDVLNDKYRTIDGPLNDGTYSLTRCGSTTYAVTWNGAIYSLAEGATDWTMLGDGPLTEHLRLSLAVCRNQLYIIASCDKKVQVPETSLRDPDTGRTVSFIRSPLAGVDYGLVTTGCTSSVVLAERSSDDRHIRMHEYDTDTSEWHTTESMALPEGLPYPSWVQLASAGDDIYLIGIEPVHNRSRMWRWRREDDSLEPRASPPETTYWSNFTSCDGVLIVKHHPNPGPIYVYDPQADSWSHHTWAGDP